MLETLNLEIFEWIDLLSFWNAINGVTVQLNLEIKIQRLRIQVSEFF
jgi:hypothetical protein